MDIGFSDTAKLQIDVSKYGVTILGNVEGYLALARFCTYMAEVHSEIRSEDPDFESGEYHLAMYISAKAIRERRFIFSPGPLKSLQPDDCVQDIFFNVTDKIGPEYWETTDSGPAEDWIDYSLPFAIQAERAEEDKEDRDDD